MCNNHGDNHTHATDHPVTGDGKQSIKVLFEPYREPGIDQALHKALEELRALPESQNQDVINRLEELVVQYPSVPSLYSSLGYMHEMQKDAQRAEEYFKQAVEKFPQNIIARAAYAGFLLRKGEYMRVAELFNNTFDIRTAYQERPTFYALEVLEFYGTAGIYHIAVGNNAEAHNALTIVKRIDPKSGYARNMSDMLGVPREDDPNFASFFKLLKKERNKVRMTK